MKNNNLLNRMSVAAPCNASWSDMKGDEQVRFCEQCKLNVYNLSAMSAGDAEALVKEKEGRLCARFFRRADGTILTSNCPVGVAALRRRVRKTVAAAVAVFALFIGVISTLAHGRLGARPLPDTSLREKTPPVEPAPTPLMGEMVMGDIHIPPAN